MPTLLAALQSAPTTQDGLTLAEVVSNLPHDPGSLFTLGLLVVAIGGIAWIGRPGRMAPPPDAPR